MAVGPNALTTLDNVKDFYGINTSLTTDDDLLEDLIDRVTSAMESYCNITHFKENSYVEYQDGTGDKYLFLNNMPIVSVEEINDDDTWTWAADTTIGIDSYRILDEKYLVLKDDLFTIGDQNIKVRYTAGYATIPDDLEQVCIEEVVRRYKHRRDIDIQSKTLDDGTVQYVSKNLMHSSRLVLNKYRNNWVY